TVAEGTTHAVPAILTGRSPRAGEFPVYTDHRQNLFTLFGDGAALHVVDEETHLCPPKLCPDLGGSFAARMGTLTEDTTVVYLHELLPDDLSRGIPSIANGWDNFLRDASTHNDPGRIAPSFVASLRPQARLPAIGLYDRVLLLVTADHGVSFRAGQKRRPVSEKNLQDIAYVPLFVKLPHQRRGRVVRAAARTIDILPTIAKAAGVHMRW